MLCKCQLLSKALLLGAHTKTLEKIDGIVTKESFLLFSQRCIKRNTADLLHFMLHRVLSVTTVKIICLLSYCYSSPFERRIDVWKLSVVHLATKSITRIDFQFSSIKTLTEDIIIQSEPEKQDNKALNSESKHSRRVRF